jgi:hypothetical protein
LELHYGFEGLQIENVVVTHWMDFMPHVEPTEYPRAIVWVSQMLERGR